MASFPFPDLAIHRRSIPQNGSHRTIPRAFRKYFPSHFCPNFTCPIPLQEPMDLDDLLPQVGEFGKYQKLMLWLVCLPACFPCGFCAFNQLFMAETPDHWCRVPELGNFSVEQRKSLAIPADNGTFSKCTRYAVNWSQIMEDGCCDMEDVVPNESWEVEGCTDGWEYDRRHVSSSIVIDVSVKFANYKCCY